MWVIVISNPDDPIDSVVGPYDTEPTLATAVLVSRECGGNKCTIMELEDPASKLQPLSDELREKTWGFDRVV